MRHLLLICLLVAMSDGMPAQDANNRPPTDTSIPPVPPIPRSPFERFRELLALSPQQRSASLAEKSELHRSYLLAKLREYDGLSRDDQELRLQTLELRHFILPLMQLAPAQRVSQFAAVPPSIRSTVEDRLQQWDSLSPDIKKEVLDHEWMMQHIVHLKGNTAAVMPPLPDQGRDPLELEIGKWLKRPSEERQRMIQQFRRFFELPAKEKAKTLNTLSDAERRRIEETLRSFESLPEPKRSACIDSLRAFANMTPAERSRFLKKAERWQAMTARERETWRRLVIELPPLPPGMDSRQPPKLPPVPPRTAASKAAPAAGVAE